ncbi:HTTM domain-containing protein [Thalassoroseus pseudoceratinae]|uniref:HTTM domain-containing protein n=1 Tax=Thalassoroseus pseudoceratinae TaxID=2713176 RepID=UPI00141D786E|nr:HTTM domain-containing protein [Thalassoroseus pseudoceratinae]
MAASSVTGFLFAVESPRPRALMRIGLAAVLLWEFSRKWPATIELYSVAGNVRAFPGFPEITLFASTTVVLHTLLLVSLVAVAVGWWTRFNLILSATLVLGFVFQDAISTLTKYNAIAIHLFVFLAFTQSGAVWSVDAWLRRRWLSAVPLSPVWPRRLMQLLVCGVYWGAAITKIRLPDFATGDLLEFSLLDDAYGGTYLGHWLAVHPTWLMIGSLLTVFYEVMFPVLVWIPQLRRVMLCCGIWFHASLWGTMHLEIFSPLMMVALSAFLNEQDLMWLRGRQPTNATSIPDRSSDRKRFLAVSASFAAFVMVAGLVVAYGLHWQRKHKFEDFFGQPNASEFREIDADDAVTMIDAYEPDYADYVHRVEVGHRMGHRHVFGDEATFTHGEVVTIMVRFAQPHPRFILDWKLFPPQADGKTPDETTTAHFSRQLESTHAYSSIGFRLEDDFPPGRYLIRFTLREHYTAPELIREIPFELVKQ